LVSRITIRSRSNPIFPDGEYEGEEDDRGLSRDLLFN
jgi:hypothetical protein